MKQFKYERKNIIYGLSIKKGTTELYCFNRDYEILPCQLSPNVLKKRQNICGYIQEGFAGHIVGTPLNEGKFKEDDGFETCFFFNDNTAPKMK